MGSYKYETHLHTKEASACATCDGASQARLYKELGYDGIIVTDHFFGGNTCIRKELPWETRIQMFCKGYENAKKEGDRIGLRVFFGIEMGFLGTEFLLYGLTKDWLIGHPEMMEWNIEEQYEKVHAAGGLVVHAHPFREAPYINYVGTYPEFTDAIEVYNLENDRRNLKFNISAKDYAIKSGLPMVGGGDAHHLDSCHGGIITKKPIDKIEDYIHIIHQKKEYEIIKI